MPILHLDDGTSKGSASLECRGCKSTLRIEINAERTSVAMKALSHALEGAAVELGWSIHTTHTHCKRCAEQGPDRG